MTAVVPNGGELVDQSSSLRGINMLCNAVFYGEEKCRLRDGEVQPSSFQRVIVVFRVQPQR
jgi:hypothetical protein